MRKLLQIEAIKTLSSNTFRAIITLHLLFFILVVLGISRINFSVGQFSIDALYQFPHVWEFFSWIASWFNILLAVLIIVMVSNEFKYNTFRQHIINGLSRAELLGAKLITLFYTAIYALVLVVVASLISGLIASDTLELNQVFARAGIVFVYFIQAVAYMGMGFLVAVIFRNNALAIVVFILYLFPGEVILRKLVFSSVENYFPAKVISDLTPLPETVTSRITGAQKMSQGFQSTMTTAADALSLTSGILLSVLYLAVFTGISYWILNKRSI